MPLRTVRDAEKAVDALRRRIGASSCTFFIRDPIWPSELHLVAMPGVAMPEPMYGFARGHATTPLRVDVNVRELVVEDVRGDARFRDLTRPPSLKPKLRALYGDFVQREQVRSLVRFLDANERQEVRAVLFINFRDARRFSTVQMKLLRQAFERLVAQLDLFTADLLAQQGASCLREIVGMLAPAPLLTSEDPQRRPDIDSLAAHALNAVGLNERNSVATIHFFNERANALELAGHCGGFDRRIAESVSLSEAQGIISWVALRRKALLINDIRASRFRPLYIPVHPAMQSELAVPILAGTQSESLIGVLNLESSVLGAFSHQNAKSIWYGASNVAIAQQMKRDEERASSLAAVFQELLHLCQKANHGEGRGALDALAALTRKQLRADASDTWLRGAGREDDGGDGEIQLTGAGASGAEGYSQTPRGKGWTNRILEHAKCPVWLSGQADRPPRVSYWIEGKWRDSHPALSNENDPAPSINPRVAGFRGHLGLPISMYERLTGVAWIRFKDRDEPPSFDEVETGLGLIAQAGLVRECAIRERHLVDSAQVARIGDRLREKPFATGHVEQLRRLSLAEAYVIYEPLEPHVGGDFYDVVIIDDDTVGFLIGDGTGKGVSGALNMLPLMAGFRALAHDSRHPPSVLDRLSRIAIHLGVDGTAAYVVITRGAEGREKRAWLTIATAGHEPVILLRKDGTSLTLPSEEHPKRDARSPTLGYLADRPPTSVQTEVVSEGDLILMYSDGVSEGLSLRREQSLRWMTDAARRELEPKAIAEAILANVRRQEKRTIAARDDKTLMVVKILFPPDDSEEGE